MKNFEFYFTGQPLTSTTHAVTGQLLRNGKRAIFEKAVWSVRIGQENRQAKPN